MKEKNTKVFFVVIICTFLLFSTLPLVSAQTDDLNEIAVDASVTGEVVTDENSVKEVTAEEVVVDETMVEENEVDEPVVDKAAADDITSYVREKSYDEYLAQFTGAARPDQSYILAGTDHTASANELDVVQDLGGYPAQVIVTDETGYVEWEVFIEEAGLYNLGIKYYPIEGYGVDIERDLTINGERPFDNARYVEFTRVWGDAGPFRVDTVGNEIRPSQIEKPMWLETPFVDSIGYTDEPYLFYFEEGQNTIRLTSRVERMAIAYLKVYQETFIPSYEEVQAEFETNEYPVTDNVFIKVQGESAILRSSPTLFAVSDHGDPTMEPYHYAEIRLNSIGGYRWAQPGQWILWEVDVPESGLYNIAVKAKQNEKVGAFSSRKLYINGQVPFSEVKSIPFYYGSYYALNLLGEEKADEPYLFYLNKGKNEIKLEVSLGAIGDIVRVVEESLYDLNTIYRRIIMITSANPDPMRTYELDKRIPGVIVQIGELADLFESVVDYFVSITGMEGEHTELLSRQTRLLRRMSADSEKIPDLLSEFRDNLGALGTWLYQTKEQALQIDYLIVASPGQEMPVAQPTWFQSFMHEIKALTASFTHEYDLVGGVNVDEPGAVEPITIWMGAGRDQAQILKQMIDNDFSPQSDIPVQLQLVPDLSNLLIKAAIAGTAPDVAIGLMVGNPVNFGVRGALHNLAEFDDFEEHMQNFMPSSIVPYSFRDNVWGISAQQSFSMMFYRKDILAELGLSVPETWDDIYTMLPILDKNQLSVGIGAGIYQSWLYQRGELMYKPDGVETNLDSEVAIRTFRELTELFSLYGIPLTFNAENRFRTGEMPIVIADYGLYNRLSVFAPELRGEWAMAMVPGTIMPDGTVNHTISSAPDGSALTQAGINGPATAILSTAKNKDHAWEFVKWWTSAETQVQFGRELESLMGAAARYPTSNIEAFAQLPWSIEEREAIMDQWGWVEGPLEVPGGYYTSRMFDWAFRAVVLENQPARETLMKYNTDIDYELETKRKEFNLELELEDVPQEYIDVFWSRFTNMPRKDY